MTAEEFAQWAEQRVRESGRQCFLDGLREELAKRMRISNFRRLSLVCGDHVVAMNSPWEELEPCAVVVRAFVHTSAEEEAKLFEAAERGNLAGLVHMLEQPHDPNASFPREYGASPLHAAAKNGHVGVARCLLQAGADKDKCDNDGFTPMHFASQNGHVEVVRCLLEVGADRDKSARIGFTPVHSALLEVGADRDGDNDGYTPMQLACEKGHVEVVRCLLEAGADKDKNTAMNLACLNKHVEVVYCLLEAGSD